LADPGNLRGAHTTRTSWRTHVNVSTVVHRRAAF
jgi:hypothetical protein